MASLPARNILDGTAAPTTSTMKTALGQLRDYLAGLLGTTGTVVDALTALGVAIPNRVQTFTSSGTWTAPSGVTKVLVTACGGGGGSGGCVAGGGAAGGGGGGASVTRSQLTVVPGTAYTITIGAGGTAGTGNGGTGGTTSFGALLSLAGGGGGASVAAGAIGAGGSAGGSGGSSGGVGMSLYNGSTLFYAGGHGGGSLLGPPNIQNTAATSGSAVVGGAANSYGAGGLGSMTGASAGGGPYSGGVGAAGILIVEW